MLNNRLAAARKYKGLKQAELADILCIYQSNISAYELGTRKPKNETLQRIAAALKLTLHNTGGAMYFCDHNIDPEQMSEDDYITAVIFNEEQEADAREEAAETGVAPASFDTLGAFEAAGGGDHGRDANLKVIQHNETLLNAAGIRNLAEHSDLLVKSGKYKR